MWYYDIVKIGGCARRTAFFHTPYFSLRYPGGLLIRLPGGHQTGEGYCRGDTSQSRGISLPCITPGAFPRCTPLVIHHTEGNEHACPVAQDPGLASGRWRGTATARASHYAGYAVSPSTTRSSRRAQINLGNLITFSLLPAARTWSSI